MRFKITVIGVAIGISCLVGRAAMAEDIESRFGQFRVGDRCSIMIAALGDPTTTINNSTLGVAHARIRWIVGSRAYVAVCIVDRLVSKRACQGSVPDC
jgi:hypothetical protein